jgi:aspartokinase/homoserine dehydrogenase 1
MKVLKFGGSSVKSAENILKVKKIVENYGQSCVLCAPQPLIVVVSAFGGITDKLIATAQTAALGNAAYETMYKEIADIHTGIAKDLKIDERSLSLVESLLTDLGNIYKGVDLIRDLSARTLDVIVSYGETLSSLIISRVLNDATLFDARKFIKTEFSFGRHIVNFEETDKLVAETFLNAPKLSLVPGFIASNLQGDATNLGRGGSDYTAAIIAAALNAEALEIWTDVDGFLTADPRVISKAYPIEQLTYVEAMELSNFGAKVVYPPTIFPVYHKNIPIWIKNTNNPEAKGTLIINDNNHTEKPIKGISSISDIELITVQGMGMLGIMSANRRIFRVLSKAGIKVFMISQASSGSSISFAVKNEEAAHAVEVLREEFEQELSQGEISSITAERDLSIVAIVGENMKHSPGISGKLFNTLGRSGINVVACAQGSVETNITIVVNSSNLRKALNAIHESFFLSEYQELNIFLVGTGTVGGSLLSQIEQQQPKLMQQNRLKLRVGGVTNIDHSLFMREGIPLAQYKELLDQSETPATPEFIKKAILEMNIFNAVFVDCTASADIAAMYKELLSNNISVVAANKIAASSNYENYSELKEIARRKDIKYLFETNVGAGLPIINTINSLVNSGDKIEKLEAVLSGTLNFIFNTLSADIPMSKAIRMAMEARFSEPDPRIDLSGTDVIRKLVILSRESGYHVEQADVQKNLFIPDDFFKGTIDNFWEKITKIDAEFEAKRKVLEAESKRWRFVAKMENGETSVGLQEVDSRHPFYDLEGSNNIILLTTERYHQYPMMIKGYGAGAEVTAAGVFSDIISIANIR